MKRILILLIGLIGIAYGQSAPTSAKTRFVNGIYLGTKLDSYFAAPDSNAIYWRADSVLRAKYKGVARTIAFTDALGSYKLVSDTFFANGYTTRARTKQVIDSLGADAGNRFVTLTTNQTISGQKTFSSNVLVTGSSIQVTNTSDPSLLLNNSTSGVQWSLFSNSSGNLIVNNGGGSGISVGSTSNITAGSFVKSGGTSSQFLMADGSVNSSVLPSGAYLPLSGGTLTGNLSGTTINLRAGASSVADLTAITLLNDGENGSNILFNNAFGNLGRITVTKKGTGSEADEGLFRLSLATNSTLSNVLDITNTGVITAYGALNGTSLSMSGGASLATSSGNLGVGTVSPLSKIEVALSTGSTYVGAFSNSADNLRILLGTTAGGLLNIQGKTISGGVPYALSLNSEGGNVLIGTTTDDGVNKLIVNGGVKGTTANFSGTTTLASASTQSKLSWLGYNGAYGQLQSDVGFDATFNGTYLVNNTNSAGNAQGSSAVPSWILSLGAGDAFKLQRSPAGSYSFSEIMTVSSSGAITASSSVTASSNILTNGEFRVDPASGDGIVRMYTAGTERAAIRANATKFFIEVGTFGERLSINSTSGLLTYTGAITASSSVTATQYRLSALNTAPSSASDTGTLGEIRIDANYIYVCTATNTWKRVAIATW